MVGSPPVPATIVSNFVAATLTIDGLDANFWASAGAVSHDFTITGTRTGQSNLSGATLTVSLDANATSHHITNPLISGGALCSRAGCTRPMPHTHTGTTITGPKAPTWHPGLIGGINTGHHPNSYINHVLARALQPNMQIPGRFNPAEPRSIWNDTGKKMTFKAGGNARLALRGGIQIIPASMLPPSVVNNPSLITPGYPGGTVGSKQPLTGVAAPASVRLTSKPAMTRATAQKQNVPWNGGRSGSILLYRPTGVRMGPAKKKKVGGRVLSRNARRR